MRLRHLLPASLLASASLLTACASDGSTASETTVAASAATATATETAAPTETAAEADIAGSANVWVGPAVDPTKLPIGDDFVSTDGASVGHLFACSAGNPNGGGAFTDGPWIDAANGTFDLTAKIAVEGAVEWPDASYSETVSGTDRVIVTNDLPQDATTGVFPIAADDPAFQIDRNPNTITTQSFSITLPVTGTVAAEPTCLPMGAVGITTNGVYLFASLDAKNRDAVAYETQDECDGHPEQSGSYHYHSAPSCLLDTATGSSTVIGYAFDGFPIVVERDASGTLPTNADLDECHGRTSTIELDGAPVETYHYSATLEFPYFIGCYRGTPVG